MGSTTDSDEGDDGRSTLLLVALAIGVLVLLVPVAIVTTAVIGAFVLDLGETVEAPPDASFEAVVDGDEVVLERHGDSIDGEAVTVVVEGDTVGTWASLESRAPPNGGTDAVAVPRADSGDLITIEWESADGETMVLDQVQVP